MFKIGEFSKLAMVTVKTLRFYDEEGILKPVFVDQWTNYRYYATEQLFDLHKIISYRQAGLSLDDIRAIIASGSDVARILEKRRIELEKDKIEAEKRYLMITDIINGLKEDYAMKFHATIKELPSYDVFYGIKKLHGFENLCEFICSLGEECQKTNPTVKCLRPEYCYVTYLDEEFTPTDFTAMYAQAVEHKGIDTDNVKFTTIPAVEAASVIVKGDYSENLGKGYAYIMKWIEDNGYIMSGKAREVYIDGVWNKENPNEYITEIQVPVKKL